MAAVGVIALGVVAVLVLIALVFVVASLPDVRRYLRLRKM